MSFTTSDIRFSLEVFPPKTVAGLDQLTETVTTYCSFDPSYITVTFGTGGPAHTVDFARCTIARIQAVTKIPVVAHITCADRSQDDVNKIVDSFYQDDIRHLVALRGDSLTQSGPYTPHPDGYKKTTDFITAIKSRYPDMNIMVAGYPEVHPESPSAASDLENLKQKIDAGASRVLSQFFFDPDVFLRWRDQVAAAGMNVPIIPGLLPILNFPRTVKFAEKCGAQVPAFLHHMFDGVEPDSLDHKLLAMNVLSHQITRLVEHEVKDFHFYTLNDTLLTRHLCRWIRSGF